jgi:hypothetical protein
MMGISKATLYAYVRAALVEAGQITPQERPARP